MTDLRTAAQQALHALGCIEYGINGIEDGPSDDTTESAITALKAALEQPEQEPVAWMGTSGVGETIVCKKRIFSFMSTPLYTHPKRREWRGLKEWEINDGLDQIPSEDVCSWSFRKGVYFAEAALKERNA